jgi:hypothetical protein
MVLGLRFVSSVFIALMGAASAAALDETAGCQGDKILVAANGIEKMAKCHVLAARRGGAVDPACVSQGEAEIALQIAAREESGRPCLTVGDGRGVADAVAAVAASIPARVRTSTRASACDARRIRDVAKSLASVARRLSSVRKTGIDEGLYFRKQKVEQALRVSFAAAEHPADDCSGVTDPGIAVALLDTGLDDVLGRLWPTTLRTGLTFAAPRGWRLDAMSLPNGNVLLDNFGHGGWLPAEGAGISIRVSTPAPVDVISRIGSDIRDPVTTPRIVPVVVGGISGLKASWTRRTPHAAEEALVSTYVSTGAGGSDSSLYTFALNYWDDSAAERQVLSDYEAFLASIEFLP